MSKGVMYVPHTPQEPCHGFTLPAPDKRPGGLFLASILPHASLMERERISTGRSRDMRADIRTMASSRSLLSALPEHLSASLFGNTTPVRLKADEVLFLAGDAGDGCYRVEDGLLKVTMVSRAGTERILAFLGSGAIVGELSIIDGLPRSASVVAVRPALLSFLSRAAFDEFANRHPDVYKSLVTVIAARLRETDATVAAGSFLPLRGRVACTLLELAQDFGQDVGAGRIVIRQKIGQSDLAAMAGIARENVSRILNDWKRRKLVSRLSGYYCLENKALLQNEAEL